VPASPATPVLIAQGFQSNGSFQVERTSTPNTGYGIQASPDLASWTSIGSAFTNSNGLLFFQDTAAAGLPKRFYRATWPLQ